MTKAKLTEILETMATKASIVNMVKAEGTYKNLRECPFLSELNGMEQTLKILGIEFEYEFNEDVTEIIAIKSKDIRVKVA